MSTFTSSGSPTFAASQCTIDGTDMLSGPAALLPATQGWFAARVIPNWAAASPTGTNPRLMQDTNDYLDLFYDSTLKCWTMEATNAANTVQQARSATQTFAAATSTFVVGMWDSSHLYVSVNAGAFVSATRSGTIVASTGLCIGNRPAGDRPFNGDFVWAAAGSGTLTSSNVTSMYGM